MLQCLNKQTNIYTVTGFFLLVDKFGSGMFLEQNRYVVSVWSVCSHLKATVMWSAVDNRTGIQFSLYRIVTVIWYNVLLSSVLPLHRHNLVPRLIWFPVVPLMRSSLNTALRLSCPFLSFHPTISFRPQSSIFLVLRFFFQVKVWKWWTLYSWDVLTLTSMLDTVIYRFTGPDRLSLKFLVRAKTFKKENKFSLSLLRGKLGYRDQKLVSKCPKFTWIQHRKPSE